MVQQSSDGAPQVSTPWRDELATRLGRAFCLVYLLAAPVLALTLEEPFTRASLVGTALLGAASAGVPLWLGKPTGAPRAWLIVAPALLSALLGYAFLGFLSGPSVLLTLTLMTGGLLLGRKALYALCAAAAVGLIFVAWGMTSGALVAPNPLSIALTSPLAWFRTLSITFLAIAVFGTLIIDIVSRLERSLLTARAETQRREQAEREKAEATISALEGKQLETLGRLSAGIAHDFNNSLTAILCCAELLRGRAQNGASGHELLDAIIESSERAASLTRQLLAYSRKAQMVLAPVDVHQLIEGATTLLRSSIDANVTLQLSLSASDGMVTADAALLQSAIINLLINARDAMPQGGQITISTSTYTVRDRADAFGQEVTPGSYLLLEVLDSGSGIDAATLPKIFEPFFTTKPAGLGTGLGLAAVAGTVRAHGGAIDVESEVGCGTVFRILLPRQVANSGFIPTKTQVVHGRGHILLVEDDTVVRTTGEELMRRLGYEVSAVPDGQKALEAVRQNAGNFDLVVLDLRMAGMSGAETFERLHQLAPKLPVLIWSGYGAELEVDLLIQQGAAGFIQKPYSVAELSRTLSALTRRAPEMRARSLQASG